ncbi:hypothetical protein CQA62_02210 [Helicobacter cholecystus]|uniref:Uncharacterized protein n=1 Tax=Helicobacter cholecystus TaxID=45498 RepID=A0A3D8IXY9_9HELI|nr:LolA-like outer membrane lipoprotein chaperone [Helicobacter cholecystus]RDU69484.1 hypothetical protein CQA62_02210 [Helicobacter cholecystus]VEJ24035.1 outer-membrane lipoprotein carrier protein [Helicobacter cholecystus]
MKRISFFLIFTLYSYALQIHSIEADFIQSSKTQPIFYKGKFIASTPNLARWEYIQPLRKDVYISPTQIISYEPMLSQVIIKKMSSTLDFIAILKNAKQDSKEPNLYHSIIEDMHYAIYFKDQIPQRVEYQDQLGESIVIELKNVKLNVKVDKKDFEFVIPKGIDVIEQ